MVKVWQMSYLLVCTYNVTYCILLLVLNVNYASLNCLEWHVCIPKKSWSKNWLCYNTNNCSGCCQFMHRPQSHQTPWRGRLVTVSNSLHYLNIFLFNMLLFHLYDVTFHYFPASICSRCCCFLVRESFLHTFLKR